MTRRHNLDRHRHSLAEIRTIMNSMKTLAYMETRKLAHFLDAQHAVTRSIENVVEDFLGFFPETLPEVTEARPVYLLIGTERGFCGDFNHVLLRHMETALQGGLSDTAILIAIGHKLHTLLEGDDRVVTMIDGASVAEEVTSVLNQLVSTLTDLQHKYGMLTVYCLCHGSEDGIVMQRLLPPFQDFLHKSARFQYPPMLNQTPRELIVDLTDHYLFAMLHELLYTSLMMENHHRVTHLEGAVQHLDDKYVALAREYNAIRQEEIIEEIEVMLLSATSFNEKPNMRVSITTQDQIKSNK